MSESDLNETLIHELVGEHDVFSSPPPRMTREAVVDVNTEPSQSEQIVWDDPTAREERAKLADNLQWPGSPSQPSEPGPARPPEGKASFRDSFTDSELVEMGGCRSPLRLPTTNPVQAYPFSNQLHPSLFFLLPITSELILSRTNTI